MFVNCQDTIAEALTRLMQMRMREGKMFTPSKVMPEDLFARGVGKSGAASLDTSSYVASQLIDEMNNAELVRTVENETRTNRLLFLENHMFERYLSRAEPALIANMEAMMQQVASSDARQQRIISMTHLPASSQLSIGSAVLRKTDSRRASVSVANIPLELRMMSASPSMTRTAIMKEGPSINMSHKADMVTREMEELRISFERLTKYYTSRKAHLKAEIEEISTMVGEIQTTHRELIDKVVIKGVEPLTKKVPARVFVRFMDEWFRKTDLLSGQLRLKTDTYRSMYKKLSAQLEEKIELGEALNPVDFDFVEIQILEVTKELAGKNLNLALLKKKTANTHREFTAFRDRLAEQLAELSKLKAKTTEKEKNIASMEKEGEAVQKDIAIAENDLGRITRTRRLYTVPEVLEYARARYTSHKLKRDIRNWSRRTGLQQKELASTKKKLHRIKEEMGFV